MKKILAVLCIFAVAAAGSYAAGSDEACDGSANSGAVKLSCQTTGGGATAAELDIGGMGLAVGMLIALGIALHQRTRDK